MFYESTRPAADASRNLSCFVEYRPVAGDSTEPELLFLATASPYHLEEVYMNPVDMLFHWIFAPGRRLRAPVRVLGATCELPIWEQGHRIPQLIRPEGGLRCKRIALDQVVFEAETKYGRCRVEMPAGDSAPICREWPNRRGNMSRTGRKIQQILGEPCREPHNQAGRAD